MTRIADWKCWVKKAIGVVITVGVTSVIGFAMFLVYLKAAFPAVVADTKELKVKAAVCEQFQAV